MSETVKIKPLRRYVAGVDPGVHTGVAVYDRREGKLIHLKQTDFFGVSRFLQSMVRMSDLFVYVEVPKMFIYSRNQKRFDKPGADKVRDRFLVNAGGNRREAQLLKLKLENDGFEVSAIDPIRETKWNARQFKSITRWLYPASQHEMDAARIAIVFANKRTLE